MALGSLLPWGVSAAASTEVCLGEVAAEDAECAKNPTNAAFHHEQKYPALTPEEC